MKTFSSRVRVIRRQLFQVKRGGLMPLIQKVIATRDKSSQIDHQESVLRKLLVGVANSLFDFLANDPKKYIIELQNQLPYNFDRSTDLGDPRLLSLITEGRRLRNENLFADERKIYELACREFPMNIEPRTTLAATKYLEGDILGWKEEYKIATEISANEAIRRKLGQTNIRILGVDWTGPMGHIAQIDAVVKLKILGLLSSERRVVVTTAAQIANPTLLESWKEHLQIFLLSRKKYLEFQNNFWPLFEHVPALKCVDGINDQTTAWSTANLLWEKQNRPPLLSVSPDLNERGERILRRWGIPDGSWFVGIHVREGFHSSRRLLPNADIMSYIPAMKRIVELGGFVIRMGNPAMTPLPKIVGVIDYAHAVERIDWMDVFIWGQARYFIGTNSGGSDVPLVFGVPTIKSNFSHIGQSFYSPNSFMVPKLFKKKGDSQPMTLSEVFGSPFAWTVSLKHNRYDVEVIDNSPEDLVAAVDEMHNSLSSTPEQKSLKSENRLVLRSQQIRQQNNSLGDLPIGLSFMRKHEGFVS